VKNYDEEFYPYEDEIVEDEFQQKKVSKEDNQPMPSRDNVVKLTTAAPPDYEPFKPSKPKLRDSSRLKLPSRTFLESTTTTTTKPLQQQTVNLPSKKYHPDSGKSTTFKPNYQDYDYDQSYETEVKQDDPTPRTTFQASEPYYDGYQSSPNAETFPSFQSNFPEDVKKPKSPPQKSYFQPDPTSQPQDHWYTHSHADKPNYEQVKTEPSRGHYNNGYPQEYEYPADDYYYPQKQSGQLDVPRREFVETYDEPQYPLNRKVPSNQDDWTSHGRPGYGYAQETSYQKVTFPRSANPSGETVNNYPAETSLLKKSVGKPGLKLNGEKAAPFVYFGPNYPNNNQPAPVEIPLQESSKNPYEDSLLFKPVKKPKSDSNLEQYPVLQDNPLLPPPMPGYSAPGKNILRLFS